MSLNNVYKMRLRLLIHFLSFQFVMFQIVLVWYRIEFWTTIGMCKIQHRYDNGVAQGDWSKTENYPTANKP